MSVRNFSLVHFATLQISPSQGAAHFHKGVLLKPILSGLTKAAKLPVAGFAEVQPIPTLLHGLCVAPLVVD